MKVYLAYSKSYEKILLDSGAKILYTYPGIGQALPTWELPDSDDLWIDSGGFQIGVGTNKYPVCVEGYTTWLHKVLARHGSRVTAYSCLDTLNAEETMKNYEYMISKGLQPVPVWKDGWPWEYLKKYCRRSELIAFGGLVDKGRLPGRYYRQMLEQIQPEFPFNRFHMFGLGITSTVFNEVKPFSIDCSTWLEPVKRGSYVGIENGVLKEIVLSEANKLRMRYDKKFEAEQLLQSIKAILTLEDEND